MTFVAILIAFFIVQQHGSGEIVHRDGWYRRWLVLLADVRSPLRQPPALHATAAVVVPAALVQWLAWAVSDIWLGLPLLLVYTVVLLYSLGRGHYTQQVETYLAQFERGDLQAAYRTALAFSHSEQVALSDNVAELHCHAVEATLYQGFERLFAVLFWFALLGPAAALAYRLAWLYVVREPEPVIGGRQAMRRAVYLAEWLPVRLLGISFALAGNFASCYRVWREHLGHDQLGNAQRLRRYGIAALGETEDLACQDEGADVASEAVLARGGEQIRALQALLSRAAVVWLVAIAVCLIALS